MSGFRNRLLKSKLQLDPGYTGIATSAAKVGDIIFYNKGRKKHICVEIEDVNATDYPLNRYIPVGVIVIPYSHNVYGTQEVGVMSLKHMSSNDPKNGTSNSENDYSDSAGTHLGWGPTNSSITGIDEYGQAVYIGSSTSPGGASPTAKGLAEFPYLPSDYFSAKQNPHDTNTYWATTSSDYVYAPSPYQTNGSRNAVYYQTTSPAAGNLLADFDGRGWSNLLLKARGQRDYSTWLPGMKVGADYPAASCCDMFAPAGFNQGDWYLPSLAELGYWIARYMVIESSITILKNTYGDDIAAANITASFTFSAYNSSIDRGFYSRGIVSSDEGRVSGNTKTTGYPTRAYTRMNIVPDAV